MPELNIRKEPDEVDILDIPQGYLDSKICCICLDKPKDAAFYPCGHECVCFPCGKTFLNQATHKLCPICRDRIKDLVKLYRWKINFRFNQNSLFTIFIFVIK